MLADAIFSVTADGDQKVLTESTPAMPAHAMPHAVPVDVAGQQWPHASSHWPLCHGEAAITTSGTAACDGAVADVASLGV